MPSVTPMMLPWLGVLMLLLLRPNRQGSAWWIWLPLGCAAALLLLPWADVFGSSAFSLFLEFVNALAFGFAAVWLLSDHLGRGQRVMRLLGLVATLGGFSLLTLIVRGAGEMAGVEVLQIAILLALNALVVAAAFGLAAWVLRGRYRPVALFLWLFVALLLAWSVVGAPFFVFIMISSSGQVPLQGFMGVVLTLAAVSFGTALPFLILSSCCPLYRRRLKALLHLDREAAPSLIAPLIAHPRS
jgi:hypothetical protein